MTCFFRSLCGAVIFLAGASWSAAQDLPIKDTLPSPPAGKTWKLVWHDEFNGKTLDAGKWTFPNDGRRRDGYWDKKAVSLDGQGHLVIRTYQQDGKFISGATYTHGKYTHKFGYYVARIQLQKQGGHWPAFWLTGGEVGRVGDDGRDGTEIDVMEKFLPNDLLDHALHWDGYGKHHRQKFKRIEFPGVREGWHTFSVHWLPDEYVFYVDGQETWRTNAGGVCQVPLYLFLSDEIGKWAGDIKNAKLPDQFLTDYVRVYDLVDQPQRAAGQ